MEEGRDARVARQQLERLEVSTNYLQHAARLRAESNHAEDKALTRAIKRAQEECLTLKSKCSGRIESRRRPRKELSADACTVYLDECGQHLVGAHDAFPVFVLAAVIIRDLDRPVVDAEWKRWKVEHFGHDAIVHEPDVRRSKPPFRGKDGEAAISALPDIIGELDFAALAVVVHRAEFMAEFGEGPLDASLPSHAYMMALDFLVERTVLALDSQFEGAKATLVAESRGSKEDTLLQHEFARLHLDGTSYISPSWFRQQLHPGVRFLRKQDNDTGLQLADLLARPVGEKVANPDRDPDRWQVMREKLTTGQETKHSILGLKVVPWHERYEDLWKS